MDKQQFDHIENRIRKAADEISIPANEAAWEKMQVLLDNEFNKKHRRRGGFWWFSLTSLIIAGLGIYFYQIRSSETTNKIALNKVAPGVSQPIAQQKLDIQNKKNYDNAQSSIKESQEELSLPNHEVLLKKQPGNTVGSTPENRHSPKMISKSKNDLTRPGKIGGLMVTKAGTRSKSSSAPGRQKNKRTPGNEVTNNLANNEQLAGITTKAPDKVTDNNSLQGSAATATVALNAGVQKDSLVKKDSVTKKITKTLSNPPAFKGFYLLVSIAGDATGVKKIPIKEINPVYGIGIGYSFNKWISLQTGFYAGKRIYKAGPDDYKVTPGSYIAKIISADAECDIYDIPISLRYNILQRKNYNLYSAVGLSTYILKKEIYDMHFYNPSGSYRHMSYTYKNNTDYFSILNLSVGFEHKLSNAFYIQAEPYVKLPLSGLGEGDVKLYSAGLQLGIKYQHIKKKKK